MRLKPLTEWCCVDLYDGRLGESVGTDKFVVGGMVGYGDDADFAGYAFAAPAKVSRVEAEGAVFLVSTTGADKMDTFGADPRIGRLTTFLKGSAKLSAYTHLWPRGVSGYLFLR